MDVADFESGSLAEVEAECPGFHVRVTARALTRYYNSCIKPLRLTAEQFSLLVGIGAAEGPTLVELANRAGVSPTTLSRSVQNLESRGWVSADGGRGRAGKRLTLTTSGRRLVVDALPLWKRAKAELTCRMGEERLYLANQIMVELAKAAESSST